MECMEKNDECEALPIFSFKDELMRYIQQNQIVICVGETGSGKTTQIPQYCADSGLLQGKRIAVTQPRRVAAITVAERVVEERKGTVAGEVGYRVRFDDSTSESTTIVFMTDGILVRECLHDALLSKYAIVMLDEAHERSINTDILFGLVKTACQNRSDLKVIITSATLDVAKYSGYFRNCPIVHVPGRLFPVDLYHSKTRQVMTISGPATKSYVQAAVDTVIKIHESDEEGHILVFLTGQDEIETACTQLREYCKTKDDNSTSFQLMILPLYASLSPTDQKKAFTQVNIQTCRKCVFATNIAETSVTVSGIKFVVDTGYVKQKVYDPSRRMESLLVVPISQVSAQQRAGRAGRTGAGHCYRLYSTQCYEAFAPETVPEIRRCNLSNTLLYLKALHIDDVMGFDFMDAPSVQQMEEGLIILHMLGALDNNGRITDNIGRAMLSFPLEPCLSRMLIESMRPENNCFEEVVTIVAMLSTENIWEDVKREYKARHGQSSRSGRENVKGNGGVKRGRDELVEDDYMDKHAVEDAHAKLYHRLGDHFTYLKIYESWESTGFSPKFCDDNYLRFSALRTVRNIRSQLISDAESIRGRNDVISDNTASDSKSSSNRKNKAIQHCIVSGLFMNAARKCANEVTYRSIPLSFGGDRDESSKSDYQRHQEEVKLLHFYPSCSLKQNAGSTIISPEYLVYQDLVYSNKLLMRHVMAIDSSMLNPFRSAWTFVNPLCLSGRKPAKVISNSTTHTNSSNHTEHKHPKSETSSHVVTSNILPVKESGADAARARYLARKNNS